MQVKKFETNPSQIVGRTNQSTNTYVLWIRWLEVQSYKVTGRKGQRRQCQVGAFGRASLMMGMITPASRLPRDLAQSWR